MKIDIPVPSAKTVTRFLLVVILTLIASSVAGAVGVEMLSGVQADRYGEENFTYAMIITAEELLEMLGVAIFIHAVLSYINSTINAISVQVQPVRKT